MGRPRRVADGGLIYHVLNRANARMKIFDCDGDYMAFETILEAAVARFGTRVLAWCLMPNHWHFVVQPRRNQELSQFMGWLTLTHTQRWHAHRGTQGSGHVYQGRFKSFPVQSDAHYLTVCRYVERNALRANLVAQAQDWRWSSLWRWCQGPPKDQEILAPWPVRRPEDWLRQVNDPQSEQELAALQMSIARGRPLGDEHWSKTIVRRLGLESTLRPRGRPKLQIKGS